MRHRLLITVVLLVTMFVGLLPVAAQDDNALTTGVSDQCAGTELRLIFANHPWNTAIQPLLCGDDARALAMSRALEASGWWVAAIRPPTVPEGRARLRITLTAAHSEDDVDGLVEALERARGEVDGAPDRSGSLQ